LLTNTEIKNLKPKEKLYRKADSHGLAIEVAVSGSKIWVHRYRYRGKATMMVLGHFPDISLLEARSKRDKNKSLLKEGINPQSQNLMSANDFESKELFEDQFKLWFNKSKNTWADSHARTVIQRAQRYLLPHIGRFPVSTITHQNILHILKSIDNKGRLDTLQKVKGIASQVFKFSIANGYTSFDPTRDIPSTLFQKKKVSHYAKITTPKLVGKLLRDIENSNLSDNIKNALLMTAHIFLRPNEIAGLLWDEVDLSESVIRIKPERMKMKRMHIVPLSIQSIKIIDQMRKISGDTEYVFPGMGKSNKHISPESLRNGLRKIGYTKEQMTTHGFRGMASTLLHEMNIRTEVIEKQLAHEESNKVKAAYNHAEYLPERFKVMQKWSDYLDSLKSNDYKKFSEDYLNE